MKSILFAALMLVMLAACSNNQADRETAAGNDALQEKLIGEWSNLYLKVETNGKNNSDSNEILEVTLEQWEDRLRIKPIRSFFNRDSTWHSAHYNLRDSLVYDPSGRWWVSENRLIMMQSIPAADTTVYSVVVNGDTASFEAMLDWDMDGRKDDKYFGKQIRRTK